MRSWKNNKFASISLVVALIVTVVVLVIGVYILATFQASMPNIHENNSALANSTADAILGAGWSAFGLAVIIPIIVVASAVIGYIVKGFGGGR